MPLIHSTYSPNRAKSFVWKRTEEDSFFYYANDIRSGKWDQVLQWSATRRSEWLSGRYLILTYAECSSRDLIIDPNGKPTVAHSDSDLSISHSGDYVAISISPAPVGIDIQLYRPSITRIAHKYANAEELEILSAHVSKEIDQLHYLWCIKEAMYKAYGRRKLEFLSQIRLDSLELENGQLRGKGTISKDGALYSYTLNTYKINELYIAGAYQV